MKSDITPLGSTRFWRSAQKHAEELAFKSGEATIIYYRPIDENWFVLRANAPAPKGHTIKTTVYPAGRNPYHHDIQEHPLSRPVQPDVHI